MLEVVFGVVFFTGIVVLLVFLILAAKSKLVASGNVDILINGEKTVKAPVGSKLLGALANANLFVSSACGGGGTCAQCRVKVFEGAERSCPRKPPASTNVKRPRASGWPVRSPSSRT